MENLQTKKSTHQHHRSDLREKLKFLRTNKELKLILPEAQILWLSDANSQLIGKHPDVGKD